MTKLNRQKIRKIKKNLLSFDLSIVGKMLWFNIWFVEAIIYVNYDKFFESCDLENDLTSWLQINNIKIMKVLTFYYIIARTQKN